MRIFILVFLLLGSLSMSAQGFKWPDRKKDPAKADSIRRVAEARRRRNDSIRTVLKKQSVRITAAYLGRPNSVGGVDAYVYYRNKSSKTIKYCEWYGLAINAVGDSVACQVTGEYERMGRDTGPVKTGRRGGGRYQCAWYNNTAKKLKITAIKVYYMDGSGVSLFGDDIRYAFED